MKTLHNTDKTSTHTIHNTQKKVKKKIQTQKKHCLIYLFIFKKQPKKFQVYEI